MKHIAAVANTFIDTLEKQSEHPELFRPVSTGIDKLDEAIGGIAPGMYIALGGSAKVGKTTVAVHLAVKLALSERGKVGIFSLEELDTQAAARMLARETFEVNRTDMYRQTIDSDGFYELRQAQKILETYNLYIEDGVFDLAKILEICEKEDITWVVIDYMNLARLSGYKNEVERLMAISRTIVEARNVSSKRAITTGKLPVTFIVLYQLNDDQKAFGSRAVYKDADLIIEVTPVFDDEGNIVDGKINMHVRPSRMARETGALSVIFSGAHCRIENDGDVVMDFKNINVMYNEEKGKQHGRKSKIRARQATFEGETVDV